MKKEESIVSLRIYALALALGLGGCIKKPLIKPEEPVDNNMYIERFQDQDDPEQFEMFSDPKGRQRKNGGADIKRILERMKNNPAYSNEIIEKINKL